MQTSRKIADEEMFDGYAQDAAVGYMIYAAVAVGLDDSVTKAIKAKMETCMKHIPATCAMDTCYNTPL